MMYFFVGGWWVLDFVLDLKDIFFNGWWLFFRKNKLIIHKQHIELNEVDHVLDVKSVALPSGHNLILTHLLVDATSWSSWWYVFVPSNSVETSSTPLIALTTPESHPSAESASFASGNLFQKKDPKGSGCGDFQIFNKTDGKKMGITLGPPHLWPVLYSLKKSSSLLRGQWHQKVNTFFDTSFYLSFEDS